MSKGLWILVLGTLAALVMVGSHTTLSNTCNTLTASGIRTCLKSDDYDQQARGLIAAYQHPDASLRRDVVSLAIKNCLKGPDAPGCFLSLAAVAWYAERAGPALEEIWRSPLSTFDKVAVTHETSAIPNGRRVAVDFIEEMTMSLRSPEPGQRWRYDFYIRNIEEESLFQDEIEQLAILKRALKESPIE